MQTFTPWQYLMIDLANHFELDKLLFEERIVWAEAHIDQLEELIEQCPMKTRPLFHKTVLTIRKVQRGEPVGHLVGFDAVCSGMQIMSALTGCHSGAEATGLVDPNKRADAYTEVTEAMDNILGFKQANGRKAVKTATMTTLYGSKAEPEKLYGKDTPELEAFYQALKQVAPGAVELLGDALASWQPFVQHHEWRLPDNHRAFIPVMNVVEKRVEVDELDHATFTYQYRDNVGQEYGLSNAANIVHSIDAYVLRCLERRCNYDAAAVNQAYEAIHDELLRRFVGVTVELEGELPAEAVEHIETAEARYQATNMADVVIAPWVTMDTVTMLSTAHLEALLKILTGMKEHAPFPILSVHDEFKCHPANMNYLRQHYIDIFVEMAESDMLSDIFSQVMGTPVKYQKLSNNLAAKIRNSNYAIC